MTVLERSLYLRDGSLEIIVACPTGANHVQRGTHCQDAAMVSQSFFRGVPFTIIAVADGHGSARYVRSDIGAHLALEAFRDVAMAFARNQISRMLAGVQQWRREARHEFGMRFGRVLVERWRERVAAHIRDSSEQMDGSDTLLDENVSAYGTTIAAVILLDGVIFAGGIGDSCVMIVTDSTRAQESNDGESKNDIGDKQSDDASADSMDDEIGKIDVQTLVGADPAHLGLSTPSLSSKDAARYWRTSSFVERDIGMVLVTTDGLTDTLRDPLRSAEDIYLKVRENGVNWLIEILPRELRRWSDEGVGDDMCTVVLFPKTDTVLRNDENREGL